MTRDIDEMKLALADAITMWAELEDTLALLLSETLGSDAAYGPLIYFKPVATGTRFDIVDAVLSVRLKGDPQLWQFIPIWSALLVKLNKARRKRNLLAHGAVVIHSGANLQAIRLTGPRFHPSSVAEPKQLPGMSLNDVRAAYTQFWHSISAAAHLTGALASLRSGRGTPATLEKIALELTAHLKTNDPQIADLSSTAHEY